MSSTNTIPSVASTDPSITSKATPPSRRNSEDPSWAYTECLIPGNYQKMKCKLCNHVFSGGISRAKEHLTHKKGNVTSCPNVTNEAMNKIRVYMKDVEAQKFEKKRIRNLQTGFAKFAGEKHDEDLEILEMEAGSGCGSSKKGKTSESSTKGPMDLFVKADRAKQATLDRNNPIKINLKKKAWRSIAKWAYETALPFHAFDAPSFQKAVYAIGEYGKLMEAPSMYQLRVPLLKDVYEETTKFVESFRVHWQRKGCSIMSNFWTDGSSRTLINFLVNCSQGTVFLKSIDASDLVKTAESIVTMIEEVIEFIGAENVVQFITDNGSNYKAAGAILEKKYPTMFWTPCAAHCCNLMLQDMGEKIPKVKSVLLNARSIVVYIYNHGRVLNLMRKFTKGELHRSCVTRFASQFYTLQSLVHNYDGLRMMFVSETWSKSDYAKKPEGARIAELVVRDAEFWNDVSFACAIMAPIVDVLRLVDTEEKPCMGYIYEAMDRAKEQIQKNIGEDKAKSIQERTTCREMRCTVWAMIDNRWEFQLHRPLHAAGFYLNPSMFYSQLGSDPSLLLEYNEDIKTGLHRVFDRLAPTTELNQKLYEEVISYREAEKTFGTDAAIRSRLTMTPADWWGSFGSTAPNLQKFAIRILSQTCSSSPCERNWSAFNNVHSEKRNCLLAKKLNDLVYIQYNKKLKRRFKARMTGKDNSYPILLRQVDENDDWVIPTKEDLSNFLREGDDVEWSQVEAAMNPERGACGSGSGRQSLCDGNDGEFFMPEGECHVEGHVEVTGDAIDIEDGDDEADL